MLACQSYRRQLPTPRMGLKPKQARRRCHSFDQPSQIPRIPWTSRPLRLDPAKMNKVAQGRLNLAHGDIKNQMMPTSASARTSGRSSSISDSYSATFDRASRTGTHQLHLRRLPVHEPQLVHKTRLQEQHVSISCIRSCRGLRRRSAEHRIKLLYLVAQFSRGARARAVQARARRSRQGGLVALADTIGILMGVLGRVLSLPH